MTNSPARIKDSTSIFTSEEQKRKDVEEIEGENGE